MHYQDETHVETNPYLCKVWHRRGVQPTLPAAGTNRRVTVFGSVEALGRGRVEVLCAGQDSACFVLYLEALERRHVARSTWSSTMVQRTRAKGAWPRWKSVPLGCTTSGWRATARNAIRKSTSGKDSSAMSAATSRPRCARSWTRSSQA